MERESRCEMSASERGLLYTDVRERVYFKFYLWFSAEQNLLLQSGMQVNFLNFHNRFRCSSSPHTLYKFGRKTVKERGWINARKKKEAGRDWRLNSWSGHVYVLTISWAFFFIVPNPDVHISSFSFPIFSIKDSKFTAFYGMDHFLFFCYFSPRSNELSFTAFGNSTIESQKISLFFYNQQQEKGVRLTAYS